MRVRTGQLGEVAPLLVPLAVSLQQGLMLVRQAFRASTAPGGQQGLMTLQHMVRMRLTHTTSYVGYHCIHIHEL